MPRLRSLPYTVAGILLLTVHLGVGAAESPRDTLRATVEQLILVLRDPALQGNARRQERVEKVLEIVRPQFAFLAMAQHALGAHWRDGTEAEQQEFVRLFTALLEQAYIGDHYQILRPVKEEGTKRTASGFSCNWCVSSPPEFYYFAGSFL